MAFDGITVAAVAAELKKDLLNSRIYKIAQPESDELIITLKTTDGGQKRLLLSADASLPLTYFTSQNKQPDDCPELYQLLRKHLQNGRITGITQPGLERIIELHVEHYNDMGDLCHKRLIIELMGKHSNIIFVNEENKIIDSIKHISGMVSSVREVLPGRDYFIPETQDKADPLTVTRKLFVNVSCQRRFLPIKQSIVTSRDSLRSLHRNYAMKPVWTEIFLPNTSLLLPKGKMHSPGYMMPFPHPCSALRMPILHRLLSMKTADRWNFPLCRF